MNLNKIIYNEDLTILSQTEQKIRAYAQQANTIEIWAPVSGFNTAYIVIQGLVNGVLNPRLRATQRLFMTPLAASGDYSRWNMVIPGSILNDMSLMNSTGIRVTVEFWYIEGDCLGVEKYNTEEGIADLLAADYPSATDGEFVRVVDTNTDWYYDDATSTWIDYESQYQVGVQKLPTSAADFTLEKGIYAESPTHAPTNTELILQELAAKLGLIGGTMSGDIDMDNNDLNNVKTVVFYNASGTAVLSFDGTNLVLNRNAVNEEILTVLNEIGDLADVIETSIADDDILIRSGANYVNVSKADFLQAVTDRLTENEASITTLGNEKEDKSNKKTDFVADSADFYVAQSTLKAEFAKKVDKITTIIGLDLQDNILIGEFKTALGNATTALSGLMSATDKSRLDTLHALLEENTANNVVDSIQEILAIFNNYPEGADLVSELATKVDKDEGKGLSTNDLTDVLKNNYDTAYTHSQIVNSNPHEVKFSELLQKPTTRDGYGITDVYTKPETYTQLEINNLLDNLSAVKGLKSTLLTPNELSNGDTISTNLLTNNGAFVVFTATDTSTGEIDSDTVPVSTIITGKKFVFFDNQEIVFTIGETNSIFETSEDITLKINLLYLDSENVQAVGVDFDGSLTNYLLNQENVQSAINKLDEELKTTNDSGFITTETDPIFTAWDKSTGISITKSQINDLIEATKTISGLMSATDKTRLDTLHALLEENEANTVVDSINEVLAIFNNYPEGADLVSALANKVDKNNAITAGTKTKITFDEKGLVTGGSDLVPSDIGAVEEALNDGKTYARKNKSWVEFKRGFLPDEETITLNENDELEVTNVAIWRYE